MGSVGNAVNRAICSIIEESIVQRSLLTRSAFVRRAVDKISFETERRYNVLIFDMSETFIENFHGIQSFETLAYIEDNRIFGVWVFEHGTFEIYGNAGEDNLGMFGFYEISANGKTICFKKL